MFVRFNIKMQILINDHIHFQVVQCRSIRVFSSHVMTSYTKHAYTLMYEYIYILSHFHEYSHATKSRYSEHERRLIASNFILRA